MIQGLETSISEYTRRFLLRDSADNSVELNCQILKFFMQVTGNSAVSSPVQQVRLRYREFITGENEQPGWPDEIMRFCDELSGNVIVFDSFLADADRAIAARTHTLQNLPALFERHMIPYSLRARNEIEDHKRAVAELAKNFHAATVTESRRYTAATELMVAVLDEFARLSAFIVGEQLADLIANSARPIIDWKAQVAAAHADTVQKRSHELAELEQMIRDAKTALDTSAHNEEDILREIAAAGTLRAQLACETCYSESSHVIAGCGHMFCEACATNCLQNGSCPVCGGKIDARDILEIAW
jgi:hypothetical protein